MRKCPRCGLPVPDKGPFCEHCGAEVGESSHFAPGREIGRYRLVRKIGEGGMGMVYEGEHLDLRRKVALKILTIGSFDNAEAMERFRREARHASQIDHPNAVTIHDFFRTEEGTPCLVMELVSGSSISRRIFDDGPFPVRRAAAIADQVLAVLEVAHEHGLVHRDISSRNIMLLDDDGDDVVRVLDFGIAKMVDPSFESGVTPLTKAGIVLGAPHYMSPEQCRGRPVDGRSDLYSLGIVMYEMLAGHVPYDSANPMDILEQHVKAPAPQLSSDICPPRLGEIVRTALAKDPDDRFGSAAEFRAALTGVELSGSREAQPAGKVAARLLPLEGGPAIVLEDRLTIGRDAANDLVATGEGAEHVSSRHAELVWRHGELWIRDLGSTNGTYWNGRKVEEARVDDNGVLRLARSGPAYRVLLSGGESRISDWLAPMRDWLSSGARRAASVFQDWRSKR